jgi:ABC-type uncharacterized transport system permease subunit
MDKMPGWADAVLVPLISILLAALVSSLVILAIGESPIDAFGSMVEGALASSAGWGYTLYYATNFMFTGLAVSVAFHARLFNIGGEGQAMLGGLGVALMCLFIPWPHWSLAVIGSGLAAAAFGALWALIPAYLQAKRGSHIVITTIMFNFIAASLLNYVLVNMLRPDGAMEPSSGVFPPATQLPTFQDMFSTTDMVLFQRAPANVSFFIAVAACFVVWLLLWRTRLGYDIRSFGHNERAAKYAGINGVRITIIAMLISGALAGMMAINSTQGEAERLLLNSSEGAGFIGIAVALMGRNHPLGVFLAALLFGFLYQGGAEVSFWTNIPVQIVIVMQALVILFTGALDNMVRTPLERVFLAFRRKEG